ncbi:DrmB family protein [Actinokineospora sp. NPDC004072]
MSGSYYRRVGAARPSHLMYTGGIGSLVDLPNFSVLVKGLESWSYSGVHDYHVDEPRLRTAVNRALQLYGSDQITELRSAPWMEGADQDPKGEAAQQIGAPVIPFPQWLRCTACNELGSLDSGTFRFANSIPRAPHEARFTHVGCGTRKKEPLAVAARFLLACTAGHLDEFPYIAFVHHGGSCPKGVSVPRMKMFDHGGNQAARVTISCTPCGMRRNIQEAQGAQGEQNLPACRGRHPHLDAFDTEGCDQSAMLLVAGASNQWFPITLSALALPQTGGEGTAKLVEARWEELRGVTSQAAYDLLVSIPMFSYLQEHDPTALIAAVQARHAAQAGAAMPQKVGQEDLLTPEWETLSAVKVPSPTDDFALVHVPVPNSLTGLFSHIRQVERLREARALIGFTRLDAPDPEDPDLVTRVELSRTSQKWIPASEVRGEGIFLRLDEGLVTDWVTRVEKSAQMAAHLEAYKRFRTNRRSDRLTGAFDPERGWPGERYIALHTLSHLLIRAIALDCGYGSASLAERIYAGTEDDPRTGILIYTAVPDSEGTLGGLVTLAEEEHFERIVRSALASALHCSSDPLCADRLPQAPADFLHGAACHVCLFVSETTCERGNRFLDRSFLVPIGDDPSIVLSPKELTG